jgi:hypothetical protein
MNYNVPGGMYPGKLQAIAIIQTVVGALEILGAIIGGIWVLLFGIATLGIGLLLIPIPFVFLVVGILSLVSGIKGLNRNPGYGLTLGVAIAQMTFILACDFFSFGSGLASLILLLQDDVKGYFR